MRRCTSALAEAQNGDGTPLRDLTRSQAITGDNRRSYAPLHTACPLRVYNTSTSGLLLAIRMYSFADVPRENSERAKRAKSSLSVSLDRCLAQRIRPAQRPAERSRSAAGGIWSLRYQPAAKTDSPFLLITAWELARFVPERLMRDCSRLMRDCSRSPMQAQTISGRNPEGVRLCEETIAERTSVRFATSHRWPHEPAMGSRRTRWVRRARGGPDWCRRAAA